MGMYIAPDNADYLFQLVLRRSRYFGKHGERFDRRLYSEIEAYVRIWMELCRSNVIKNNPTKFRRLLKIQGDMLKQGQLTYKSFP